VEASLALVLGQDSMKSPAVRVDLIILLPSLVSNERSEAMGVTHIDLSILASLVCPTRPVQPVLARHWDSQLPVRLHTPAIVARGSRSRDRGFCKELSHLDETCVSSST
jgi:hypothetical protein